MLKVSVKDKEFQVVQVKEGLQLNGQLFNWDMVELAAGKFHIIKNHRSFTAEVVSADYAQNTFQIKVNNQVIEVAAQDRFDLLLEELGMSGANQQKINEIKAPMPGLMLDILVNVGDQVVKGDKLLILEAMKMENVLKSPGDGTIKKIVASKGNNVEKNEVLIIFE